jgi:hypothetical protein
MVLKPAMACFECGRDQATDMSSGKQIFTYSGEGRNSGSEVAHSLKLGSYHSQCIFNLSPKRFTNNENNNK